MTDVLEPTDETSWAAEYALGLLTPVEAARFEAAMVHDAQLRHDYAFWADHYAALTDEIPEVAPAARVWVKITAQAFGLEEKSSIWERLGIWPALGGGVIAAMAVLWMLDLSGMMRWLDTPQYTAQISAEDESLVVQASYIADVRELRMTRINGGALPGRALQMWLISGDAAPQSIGVWPPGQTATFIVDPAMVPALAGGLIAVSDEPPGGSPTGAPTGAVLAVGPIVAF